MTDFTLRAISRQTDALSAELYEVGVFHNDRMLLRTWPRDDLFKSIAWLKARNAAGAAIYVRPQGEHRFNLVDDLKPRVLDDMQLQGFQPALVVETSPDNLQAWFDHGRVLPKDLSTAVARALAVRFGGDLGSADWRHFGRLAGFTNSKEKYRQPNNLFPYVRVVECHPGRVYDQAQTFVEGVRRTREMELIAAAQRAGSLALRKGRGTPSATKSIADFHSDPRYGNDLSRADLAYCVYALSHGVSEAEIRSSLLQRDLTKKGSAARVESYIHRTMVKAAEALTSLPSWPTLPDRTRELSR